MDIRKDVPGEKFLQLAIEMYVITQSKDCVQGCNMVLLGLPQKNIDEGHSMNLGFALEA